MKWNQEELEKAALLIKEGFNYIEIGKKINRSRASVKNKLEEIGLKYKIFNSGREKRNCVKCSKEFETTKSDEKIFCSQSCSAVYNNQKRSKKIYIDKPKRVYVKRIPIEKNCLSCKKELSFDGKSRKQSKFCSNICQSNFVKNKIFEKIENGDVTLNTRQYKNYLIHKHGEKCMECGWNKTNTYSNKIPIELEHIDGNSENNELSNLKLLCPNCHYLTPTYKYLNVGMGRHSRRQRYKEGKSF